MFRFIKFHNEMVDQKEKTTCNIQLCSAMFEILLKKVIFTFLLISTRLQVKVDCQELKTWIPNTNFGNYKNWDLGRQPNCDQDSVVFPISAPLTVYIQQSLALKSIALPLSGELVLPVTGTIDVQDKGQKRDNCKGKEVRFNGHKAYHWFDPNNWNLESQTDNTAVPHSERVPCPGDRVIFPEDSSFKVIVKGNIAKINAFQINKQIFNEGSLRAFLSSETGKRQFDIESGLSVTGNACTDLSGCICGNERPLQLDRICSHMEGHCPQANCADPIKPIGFCCEICGASISGKTNYRFHFKKFKDFINSRIDLEPYESVSKYVYITYTGSVEVVIVDSRSSTRNADILRNILRQLQDENQATNLGVNAISSRLSTIWLETPEKHVGEIGGLSAGGVAALIIGLLALVVIVILFYIQRHRLIPIAFSFGRFENEEDNYSGGMGFELAQPAVETSPQKPPRKKSLKEPKEATSLAFENPNYTDKPDENKIDLTKECNLEDGENPCYVAFERLEDITEMKAINLAENATADDAK